MSASSAGFDAEQGLPNPERSWRRVLREPTRAEIEARVGPAPAYDVLSGGLANANVRLDGGRILRLYRRDVRALATEARLLAEPWDSFRVPRVLGRGDDFLVLEDVPHDRLPVDATWGRAVGRALAEVHARRYLRPGFLAPDLRVERPFDDWFGAFRRHTEAELRRAEGLCPPTLPGRVLAHLDSREAALREAASAFSLLHGDFKASNLHRTEDERLLVLDWEFAYAGPPLLDVGQLVRWGAPASFVDAFATAYWRGQPPPEDWRGLAATFDLFNLAGLLAGGQGDARRTRDLIARIEVTLGGTSATTGCEPSPGTALARGRRRGGAAPCRTPRGAEVSRGRASRADLDAPPGPGTPERRAHRLRRARPRRGDSFVGRLQAPRKAPVPFEHGENVDPVGPHAVHDAVGPLEHLAHVVAPELGHATPRKRRRGRLLGRAHQLAHPALGGDGVV
ncbi:MAG TPA: phosphotransferase, partial [Polyangiaceae bacterium]|nr:phosphotransferase [Polyangiaceae bacterium]